MKNLALVLMLLFASKLIQAQESKTTYINLTAKRFNALVSQKNAVVIDLRTPNEIKGGKIKGAIEIDFLEKDAEAKLEKLDKSKTYLLYCAGGGRSADASAFMIEKGFKSVYNLEKGFDEWKKSGLDIEKK